MLQFKDCTDAEQQTILTSAHKYWKKYHSSLIKLVGDENHEVLPSGSDLFRPELWKPMHWKWFLALDKDIN